MSLDLFKTGANTLLEETVALQGRKGEAMMALMGQLQGLQEVQPVSQVTLDCTAKGYEEH